MISVTLPSFRMVKPTSTSPCSSRRPARAETPTAGRPSGLTPPGSGLGALVGGQRQGARVGQVGRAGRHRRGAAAAPARSRRAPPSPRPLVAAPGDVGRDSSSFAGCFSSDTSACRRGRRRVRVLAASVAAGSRTSGRAGRRLVARLVRRRPVASSRRVASVGRTAAWASLCVPRPVRRRRQPRRRRRVRRGAHLLAALARPRPCGCAAAVVGGASYGCMRSVASSARAVTAVGAPSPWPLERAAAPAVGLGVRARRSARPERHVVPRDRPARAAHPRRRRQRARPRRRRRGRGAALVTRRGPRRQLHGSDAARHTEQLARQPRANISISDRMHAERPGDCTAEHASMIARVLPLSTAARRFARRAHRDPCARGPVVALLSCHGEHFCDGDRGPLLPTRSRHLQALLRAGIFVAAAERAARRIIDNTLHRHALSRTPPEELLTPRSLEEKSAAYAKMRARARRAVGRRALDRADLDAGAVDMIITTSCTGVMIPSVDAFLVEQLGMRATCVRLPHHRARLRRRRGGDGARARARPRLSRAQRAR